MAVDSRDALVLLVPVVEESVTRVRLELDDLGDVLELLLTLLLGPYEAGLGVGLSSAPLFSIMSGLDLPQMRTRGRELVMVIAGDMSMGER